MEIRKVVNIYSLMIPGGAVCRLEPTEGNAALIGGIDSPVAGYMIAKRGVKTSRLLPCSAIHQRPRKAEVVDLGKLVLHIPASSSFMS